MKNTTHLGGGLVGVSVSLEGSELFPRLSFAVVRERSRVNVCRGLATFDSLNP